MQFTTALERNCAHTSWFHAYNRQLNALETSTEPLAGFKPLATSASCFALSSNVVADDDDDDGDDELELQVSGDSREKGHVSRAAMKVVVLDHQKSVSLQRPLLPYSCRLLTPIQRFQRYHLLIDRLKHYSTEESDK